MVSAAACTSCDMKKPDIKQNVHPKQRYELILTIEFEPHPSSPNTYRGELYSDNLATGLPYTEYFARKAFADDEIPGRRVTPLGTNYVASRRAEDFFSATLTVKELRE